MEPNILFGAKLEVDEDAYSSKGVQRFDIVVIRRNVTTPNYQFSTMMVVARIVGLGGETILIRDNQVLINGKKLEEPFKTLRCAIEEEDKSFQNFGPFSIPKNEFFLVGDNRCDSEDSRFWQPHTVSRDAIIGRVVTIVNKRTSRVAER
jgi:signal peptidase I